MHPRFQVVTSRRDSAGIHPRIDPHSVGHGIAKGSGRGAHDAHVGTVVPSLPVEGVLTGRAIVHTVFHSPRTLWTAGEECVTKWAMTCRNVSLRGFGARHLNRGPHLRGGKERCVTPLVIHSVIPEGDNGMTGRTPR